MIQRPSRRSAILAATASFAAPRLARAAPATIAGGSVIGREKMLIVEASDAGRILAWDSGAYLDAKAVDARDVVAFGSYAGVRILAPMFTRGVRALIATDAGIGKDEAGVSGLSHGEAIGVPVAAVAVMSAETSNGRSTLLGAISRANAPARALGVREGMPAWQAAEAMLRAPEGRPTPTPLGEEETPFVVETTPQGRIWATPGTTAIRGKIPHDVFCSGSNCSRVFSDGALRMGAKGAIANDAGIALNNSAVEGVFILGASGVPAASVATMSARLGEGPSTWNDGVISVVNEPAARLGVVIGMSAKEAARKMLARA